MAGYNRFKRARLELNQHGKQSVKQVSQNTGFPASFINDLEANTSNPRQASYLKIATLAKYYGVSMDWLSGNCEVPSVDITVAKICEITGLNEEIVSFFIQRNGVEHSRPCDDDNFNLIPIFNAFFTPDSLESLLIQIYAFSENIGGTQSLLDDITMEKQHATSKDGKWLRPTYVAELIEKALSTIRDIRYSRFEAIDEFTRVFDNFATKLKSDSNITEFFALLREGGSVHASKEDQSRRRVRHDP